MKDFLTQRLVLVILSALASSVGTALAVAQPAIHKAFCTGISL